MKGFIWISFEPVKQDKTQKRKMETSTLMEATNEYMHYDLDKEESKAEDKYIDIPIIPSIVILFSVTVNLLVVVISVFSMRRRSLINIFILNLALSDLLFTVGLAFMVYDYIWGLTLGDAVCKAAIFLSSNGYFSSIMLQVLMSFQHYVAVVHPLSGWKKGHCVTLLLICAWVGSILAALPVTVHAVGLPNSGVCSFSSKAVAIVYEDNIVFVCAFLFMAFCYIRILQTIFKSPTHQTHKTALLAFLLVATFFICWAPYNLMLFLSLTYQDEVLFQDFYYAIQICELLAFTRCCFNPVIYVLFGLIFHKSVREIFQRQATFESAQMRI